MSRRNDNGNFNKGLLELYDFLAKDEADDITKKLLNNTDLHEQRNILWEYLKKWFVLNVSPVKLDISPELLKDILTDVIIDSENNSCCRLFVFPFEAVKKLDLSDLDFSSIVVDGLNFTGSKGVKIDPQTVNCGSLQRCNFNNVTFIGNFYYNLINGSCFEGSKDALIDLNYMWDIRGFNDYKTVLTDATVIEDGENHNKLNSVSIVTDGALIVGSYDELDADVTLTRNK